MDHYEDVANVEFEVVTGREANINFMYVDDYQGTPPDGAYAFANLPSSGGSNVYMPDGVDYSEGGYAYQVMGHELGHAMGMSHPRGVGDAAGYDTSMTIMSYNNDGLGTTLQPLDIATMQHVYGENPNYNNGNNTYYLDGSASKETIWDTGGVDTIDSRRYNGNVQIDLRDQLGAETRVGYSRRWIAEDAEIENATSGWGNDVLLGNDLDNRLDSGQGNDHLRGYGGDDELYGGEGNDTFYFAEGFGNDTVFDYNKGDIFSFDKDLFANTDDILANTEYRNGNAIITDGNGNSVTIRNVAPNSLTADDVAVTTLEENSDHSMKTTSAIENPLGDDPVDTSNHLYSCGCLACAGQASANQSVEASDGQDAELANNNSVSPLVVAGSILSAGIISMGVAGYNHIQSKKTFQETVDTSFQKEFQKQKDAGEEPSAQAAYKNSNLREVKNNYIKQSSRTWGVTGFMTGAGIASAAVAAAGVLSGGMVPLALAGVGLAAGLVGGVVSYFTAKKAITQRAESYITNSSMNAENQKGIDPTKIQQETNELNADKAKMLQMTDKLLSKQQQAVGADYNRYNSQNDKVENDKVDWLDQKGVQSVGYAR